MTQNWEIPLGALRRGRHTVLYHRGLDIASRVASRFTADGLANGEVVVLAAEPTEIERIALSLTGASPTK